MANSTDMKTGWRATVDPTVGKLLIMQPKTTGGPPFGTMVSGNAGDIMLVCVYVHLLAWTCDLGTYRILA